MTQNPIDDHIFVLSTLPASPGERRLAGLVVVLSLAAFAALAPLAKTPLGEVVAFIPSYQASLVVLDMVTVALLLGQYFSFYSRAMFVLACGYMFTAVMTVVHAFTFPGLFAPTGLLGAGPQSTAWLYMFWHGGFPLFVIGYTLLEKRGTGLPPLRRPLALAVVAVAAMLTVVAGFVVLVTCGQTMLPAIMVGHTYTPLMISVVSSVWLLSLGALVLLWLHKPYSVLDLWLMVVMCAWLIDIALSAVLNHGRFDLGFYAGRAYGLMAASFVLAVLLVESGMLHKKLVHLTVRLRQLTVQDALTGIANRRAFDGALDLEWRRAVRSGLPLSLMMIDVDHFKRFNDSYGHIEGDQCLRAVAGALQAAVARSTDLVARYGGEEFVVLLPQTDAKAAGQVAERLRRAVADLSIENRASDLGCVTISIGVAGIPAPGPSNGRDIATLVQMADQALYEAKSKGRDRVAVAHAEPCPV